MGRGEAKRRRLVNALKAQAEKRGKAFNAEGVSKKKQKKDSQGDRDVPSSFRKLLALKAAAEGKGRPKQQQQQQQLGQQHQGHLQQGRGIGHAGKGQREGKAEPIVDVGAGSTEGVARETAGEGAAQQGSEPQQAQQQVAAERDSGGNRPPADGRAQQNQAGEVQAAGRQQQQQLQQAQKGPQTEGKKGGRGSEPAEAGGRQQQQQQAKGGGLFKEKVLRANKKEYLKMKKLKKKGKLQRGDDLGDREAELAVREAAAKPQFGEQAYQPIKANLKRRHWADQERSAAERCKEVFLQQMKAAEQRAAALTAGLSAPSVAGAGGLQRQQGRGAAGAGPALAAARAGGKTGQQQQQKQQKQKLKQGQKGGGKAGGKVSKGPNKSKASGGSAHAVPEAERLQLIEAYREAKRQRLEAAGKGMGTSATPQSLAALVKRDIASLGEGS